MRRMFRSIVVLALLFLAPLPAHAALKEGAADTAANYEDAVAAFDQGEYASAIIHLKNALTADPDYIAARILLGRAHLRLGDGASAEKELRRAAAAGGDPRLIDVPLGQAYIVQTKYRDVIQDLKPGGRPPEEEVDILVLRGQAHLAMGDVDAADGSFATASALQPQRSSPLLGLTRVRLLQGNLEAAISYHARAMEVMPESPDTWFMAGELERNQLRLEAAARAYDRAIEIEPYHVDARLARAAVLIGLNRHEKAREDLEFVQTEVPSDPQAAYLMGLVQARLGNEREAVEALRLADSVIRSYDEEYVRNNSPTLLLAGMVNFSRRNWSDARFYLELFVRSQPHHIGARLTLGSTLLELGDPEGAASIVAPAAEWLKDDPEPQLLLGAALMRSGQHEKAIEVFEKATRLDPGRSQYRTYLAISRLMAGEPDAAGAELVKAIETDGKAVRPALLLGLVRLRQQDYDAAIKIARLARERAPDNALALNLLGAALWGKGERDEARAALQRALELKPDYHAARTNLARMELKAGDEAAARQQLLKIIELSPDNAGAMVELAKIEQAKDRIENAITWLEKAQAADPKDTLTQMRLVDLYIRANKPKQALGLANRIPDKEGRDPRLLEVVGRAQTAAGEYKLASATLRRLSSLIEDSGDRLIHIARLQLEAQDVEGAHESLTRAVWADPMHLPARRAIIRLESRTGRTEAALQRVDEMIDTDPKNSEGYMLRGDVLQLAGRTDDALAAYELGLLRAPHSALMVRYFLAQRERNDEVTAIPRMEAWLQDRPDDLAVRRVYASALLATGARAKAMKQYERLYEAVPNDAGVLNDLAQLYGEIGDARAIEYARRALRLAPTRPETLDTLGWLLIRDGQHTEGLGLLRDAQARDSRSATIRYHVAAALHEMGRSDQAKRELDALVKAGTPADLVDKVEELQRALK